MCARALIYRLDFHRLSQKIDGTIRAAAVVFVASTHARQL